MKQINEYLALVIIGAGILAMATLCIVLIGGESW
jgi:hypothetical protein